ncbi:MAG: 3-dehydroquinate synthase [Acidobacteriota bacterium]
MDVLDQSVRVNFRFPVHFTTGLFDPANLVLRTAVTVPSDPAPSDAVVILDSGVHHAHPVLLSKIQAYFVAHADALRLAAPPLVLPGGEAAKNDPAHLEAVHALIHDAALCRHSYVIAIGGGAILDVVGYAAATAHRGIRLIRVPTTVLSQDDSAVGVKNGVNAFGKKNYFGSFAPPFAVLNDFTFLATLEPRDWLGGVAEAVKAALIRDAAFFTELETLAPRLVARDDVAMERVVRRSAAIHLSHIANGGDPFELGASRPLDFGHWAAHRLEHLTDHRLRHGEAVAIGVALDTTYACLTGSLPPGDWRRVIDLFLALQLPLAVPELDAHSHDPAHPRSVLRGLEEFREHLGGRLTVMLLRGIGSAFDVHHIRTEVMIQSIAMLVRIQAARSSAVAADDVQLPTVARGPS